MLLNGSRCRSPEVCASASAGGPELGTAGEGRGPAVMSGFSFAAAMVAAADTLCELEIAFELVRLIAVVAGEDRDGSGNGLRTSLSAVKVAGFEGYDSGWGMEFVSFNLVRVRESGSTPRLELNSNSLEMNFGPPPAIESGDDVCGCWFPWSFDEGILVKSCRAARVEELILDSNPEFLAVLAIGFGLAGGSLMTPREDLSVFVTWSEELPVALEMSLNISS